MGKILLFAVIVTLIIIGSARYKKMNLAQKRKALWYLAAGLFICVLVILVFKGAIPWVIAALGTLFLFIRNAYGLLSQILPYWLQRKNAQQKNQPQQPPAPVNIPVEIQEALDLLGLSGDVTKGEISEAMIQDAHRRLIQKFHPDRGGNDYLAAKINQARDLLLEKIKFS
jgi:hypothetical protein